MTDHETDMLSDDQIEHGPAGPHDMAWKERVTAYEIWADLLEGVTERYKEHNLDRTELESVGKDTDALIEKVSDATDQTKEAVAAEIRDVAKSLLESR